MGRPETREILCKGEWLMKRSSFSLRLLPSLLKAAQRIAERENCSVNQLVNVALAEKVAVLDQERWDERKRKATARMNPENFTRLSPIGVLSSGQECICASSS